MCPLPLFHVFAAQILTNAVLACGGHLVLPTPQGYRGEGRVRQFLEADRTPQGDLRDHRADRRRRPDAAPRRRRCSRASAPRFPARPPLPVELFRRFREATGVEIMEGLRAHRGDLPRLLQPLRGHEEGRVGGHSLALHGRAHPRAYLRRRGRGRCPPDDIGEICVANPGVNPGSIYTQEDKNRHLFHYDTYLRTGDLGKMDADGYLWITGRAKDLIIRSGHNIDPASDRGRAPETPGGGDVGGRSASPTPMAGEIPCAYVELVKGQSVTGEELAEFAARHIAERAAVPKHVEVLDELPKTAVGKVFKPDLRRRAITRVLDGAFAEAGLPATGREKRHRGQEKRSRCADCPPKARNRRGSNRSSTPTPSRGSASEPALRATWVCPISAIFPSLASSTTEGESIWSSDMFALGILVGGPRWRHRSRCFRIRVPDGHRSLRRHRHGFGSRGDDLRGELPGHAGAQRALLTPPRVGGFQRMSTDVVPRSDPLATLLPCIAGPRVRNRCRQKEDFLSRLRSAALRARASGFDGTAAAIEDIFFARKLDRRRPLRRRNLPTSGAHPPGPDLKPDP